MPDPSNVKKATQGEAFSWSFTAKVAVGDGLSKVYLTLKANLSDADPGALQKAVTTSLVTGVGVILDSGATSGSASGRFDFTSADTVSIGPRDYWFDIKAIPASGLDFPVESGIFRVGQGVTAAAS